MRNEEADLDADLGIQAFQDMVRSMDRLGDTLKAVDRRQQIRLDDEEAEASRARSAAFQAEQAANRAQEAAQKALQAAKTELRSSLLWTGLTGLGVALAAFLVGFYVGNRDGWDQGQASGYASARNEVAAAAWANTPNGHRAFQLDQLGSLDMLASCSGANWTTEHQQGQRVCFPAANPQGRMAGWFIP